MCNKDCSTTSCPFAFTDESENIQSLGCLPSPFEIVGMRLIHGKTWACHSDVTKPCKGALNDMRSMNIDCRVIDRELVDEKNLKPEHMNYTQSQSEQIRAAMTAYLQDSEKVA